MAAGALFGAWQAVIILIIAENLSSLVSYAMGSYFGRDLLTRLDKENKLMQKFETYIRNNDFGTILTLRLLFAPFDLVGYFAGASSIAYKPFALATFFGILPGLITSAFLGGSVSNPRFLIISAIFFVAGIAISKFIKRKSELVL